MLGRFFDGEGWIEYNGKKYCFFVDLSETIIRNDDDLEEDDIEFLTDEIDLDKRVQMYRGFLEKESRMNPYSYYGVSPKDF
jgi:hypothetical protein